ncbi:hypothetical protein RYH80_15275 [Halobaculum sp. MBLA0147]|uniref:hypothetical protein n=1 Tax=Halobaculum sp. MBLA0147 TaxID=3079934 RepID=UPI0035261706
MSDATCPNRRSTRNDQQDRPDPAEMSTEALRREIERLDEAVDWFGCIADTREQWQRYQALSDELSDRDPTRVPACEECCARQWRTSPGEPIHCQSCDTTPTRERREEIRRVWTTITPREEVPHGDH